MVLELIEGVALLLALSFLQRFVARFPRGDETLARIVSGGLFGGICVIGMMLPIEVGSGVIFDARSVVLSMAGLFGGPLVGLVSATIAGAYCAWLGGGGALVGVAVIIVCTALGLAYRDAHQSGWLKINLLNLLLFGLFVHLVEVLLFTQLPHAVVATVMSTIAAPLLLTFTPATAMLGLLLKDIDDRMQIASALLASEASLSLHLQNTPLAAISWDENLHCTRWNKAATKIFGYTLEEALGKHPRDLVLGLANRQTLRHRLQQEIKITNRSKRSVC